MKNSRRHRMLSRDEAQARILADLISGWSNERDQLTIRQWFAQRKSPCKTWAYLENGGPWAITPAIPASALRASLRPFKIVPDDFVERGGRSQTTINHT